MARFSGMIGIKSDPVETSPGIFLPAIVERHVSGDILLKPIRWQQGESAQDEPKANHKLSIIASAVVLEDFSDIVYVMWQNRKWSVTNVSYLQPRIELTLGKVYNG